MATTSTIGTARAQLVSALSTGELLNKVHYAWPGPSVQNGVFEGAWISGIVDWHWQIPNIKAGRKQRQEHYVFELTIWVNKADQNITAAQAAFERCLVLLGEVEDVLADNIQINTTAANAIQWAAVNIGKAAEMPLERGWGCMITVQIEGNARLT